ncbi:hypothetical protein RP300_00939 [Oligella urethralis]|uniref:FtsH protease activity modulator HflK n=1 Tax=Oligella urethralis TaxID=90245 RepID=UPI000660DB50|nr:FtsH protease activity modulator HflK [Oligella urethralis]WOS37390.1 hypothetical protein RP300_00939 [Oligella urethralis]
MLSKIFNLNDPGWGKKPQSDEDSREPKRPQEGPNSPPDLDQVWSDVEQKFKSLFGGGNRGGSPQGPRPAGGRSGKPLSPNFFRKGIVFALIVGLLLWLASGFFIIREGQVGVITQFGEYKRTVMPGFQWHIPQPIESVEHVDIANVRAFSIGYRENSRNKVLPEALMLTEDENIVDVQFDVQYRIKAGVADVENGDANTRALSPAASYLFATADPDESVRQAAETAMREVVGKESMNNILYESRTQAAQDVMRLMQVILDRYNTGIEVITVAIQNVQPPEQVQAAFEDAIKAGQDNERQKNEGQAYASRVIPEAHGRASRLLQSAEGYRAKVVGEAIGEAERFKQIASEYAAAPEVTRERMYISTMGEIYSNASKVMLDTAEQQNNPLMFMPLDSILNRKPAATTRTVPAPQQASASDASSFEHGSANESHSTASSASTEAEYRSRNLSRDREASARR